MYKLVHQIYPTTFGYVGYTYYGSNNIIYYRLNKFKQIIGIINKTTFDLYFKKDTELLRREPKVCKVIPVSSSNKAVYRKIDNSTLQKVN